MRVLVLDEGFVSGTVTARGLRRAGCGVDVLSAAGGRGGCASGRGRWQLAPRVGDPRLLDAIDAAVRRTGCDVVYPVTEPLQALAWDAGAPWERLVYPRVAERQRAARRDKRAMSALAAAAGALVPRELPASTDGEVDAAARALGLPLVIKGARGRGGSATHICLTSAAARAAARAIAACGTAPFAQEHVAGTTFLAGGLFDRGQAVRLVTGAKSVQHPPRVGPAAELTTVRDGALDALARRVFAAAAADGLASIDVVRGSDGAYRFLELNPRPWGSIAAANGAGDDLFAALVRQWRGEPIGDMPPSREGVRTPVFPLYLLSEACWRSGAAARALVPDARRAFALARAEPRLAGHVLHRLVRVAVNWRADAHSTHAELS